MKKTIFILALFALLLSACGGGRDLSTPSSRLVGHWKRKDPTDSQFEYYFSEIDPDTDEGTLTLYSVGVGTTFISSYKILSEAPGGENISLMVTNPSGIFPINVEFVIEKDGLSAKMMEFYIEYVDGKTEFDLSDLKPTQTPTKTPVQTPTLDPSIPVYRIFTNNVGLYETLTSETPLYTLSSGERLIPANGGTTLICESISEGILMCHMYSLRLEVNGWVSRSYLIKDD